jgi:hypothetical protein
MGVQAGAWDSLGTDSGNSRIPANFVAGFYEGQGELGPSCAGITTTDDRTRRSYDRHHDRRCL